MKISVGKQMQDGKFFNTIHEAIHHARELSAKKVEIELAAGIYRLNKPIVITNDMGFESVRIFGKDRENTVLCGSIVLEAEWNIDKNGIFYAQIDKNLDIDMLYINGKLYHMARHPKYDEKIRILQGYASDCISKERAAHWSNPEGGYFHVLHNHRWGDFHFRITGKDTEGNVVMEGGTQNNRRTGIHEEYRYVENIFEELTCEGEWFYDKKSGMIYVIFEKGDVPESARVEAVVNEQLVKVLGTPEDMQADVVFQNLTFRHTKRTFMKVDEPLLRSDWCIYRGGALYYENTKNCSIQNCDIINMGSNAVCINGKNLGFTIMSSLVRDIAGNGICFIGMTDSVRSPLFEYNERMDISELDLKKGTKSDNYPSDCQVVDCLITRTGRVEKQTAAVQVSMSKGIRIANCSIYEIPRAAINFSEGNFGGHIIENCDIFDTVLETGDHGSFNSWGRDRYWELKGIDMNNLKELNMEDLPFLDAMYTNIIRNNRIRCDWGWDIDLDDGSTNYEIYNNLCLNGGIKLREGFGRKVYNNITVNNSLNVHVWFNNSGDSILHNILFGKYKHTKMTYEWGDTIDYNVVHSNSESQTTRPAVLLQKDSSKDENSYVCNCMFNDPTSGDYTVQNNIVIERGFKNFDMKSFGVISERLKSIARIPEFPTIKPLLDAVDDENALYIYERTTYKNITSLEEASAYGAGSKDGITANGVIIYELFTFIELGARGLKTGDIILGINGTDINNIDDLKKFTSQLDNPHNASFRILRDQVERTI